MKSQVTITRPANTTPYTGADVVGGAFEFTNFRTERDGDEVIITSVSLQINVSAIPSGMTGFALHLYSITPPSAIADNAGFDLPSGDRAYYLGNIDLGDPVDLGATLYVNSEFKMKHIKTQTLFGYLVTDAGYTPAGNSEVYVLTIHTIPAKE